MRSLLNRIKNIARYAVVTGGANDADQFPNQQVACRGVSSDALTLFQYGTYANLPNDAFGVMWSIDGDESNKAIIAYTPKARPSGLAQGEVAHYHPATGSSVIFRNDGAVEIDVAGDVKISASGNATVTASVVDVDASAVNLGSGGQPIARVGDAVAVSTGTGIGTITAGGVNTSI